MQPTSITAEAIAELTAPEDAGEGRALAPLQRGVLIRVPQLPLPVRLEPSAQAVYIIAERGDLVTLRLLPLCSLPPLPLMLLPPCSFLLSLLQRGILVRVPLTPLLVCIEPSA